MSADSNFHGTKPLHHGVCAGWPIDGDDFGPESVLRWKSQTKRVNRFSIVTQLLLLICNVVFLYLNFAHAQQHGSVNAETSDPAQPYSPALAGIEYTIQRLDTHDDNDTFTGKPSLEVDQAWSNLLRSTTIRVTADELRALNQPSLALKDGSGYVGYVEVFHQLHCLKRMYQFQYPEVYTDLKASGHLTLEHWEHCLQVLRKGIMCHADPTLNTFVPDPTQPRKLRGISDGPRKCVNWERFEAWAHARAIGTDIHQLMMKGEYGEVGPRDVVDSLQVTGEGT